MKQLHKEIVLGAIMVLLAVFSWWCLKCVFYNGNYVLGSWCLVLGIFILFGIALCLTMLLIKNKIILFGSFGLALLLFFIFFNNEPFYYLIVLILLFLAFWLTSKKIKKEEKIRGLPIFITALILLISLVYYFSPELMNKKETKIKIPQNVFNLAIKPIEGLIKEQLPEGVDLDSEVSKFLPTAQIRDLEQQFGVKINNKDIGRDVLYKLVDYQLNNLAGPYKKFIPLGLAIGLFITLKIVSLIYVPIVIMLSWLMLKILMLIKFVKIEKETKEVEAVRL